MIGQYQAQAASAAAKELEHKRYTANVGALVGEATESGPSRGEIQTLLELLSTVFDIQVQTLMAARGNADRILGPRPEVASDPSKAPPPFSAIDELRGKIRDSLTLANEVYSQVSRFGDL